MMIFISYVAVFALGGFVGMLIAAQLCKGGR